MQTELIARLDRTQVRSKADILANLDSGTAQLLDARGAGRFTGAENAIVPTAPVAMFRTGWLPPW